MAAFDNDPENDFLPSGAPRCHGKRTNGLRCSQPAMKAQNICRFHGGKIQRNLDYAEKKVLEEEARKMLAKVAPGWDLNPEAVTNPVQELSLLAGKNKYLLASIWPYLHRKDTDCECCGSVMSQMDPGALVAYTMAEKAFRASLNDMDRMKINERMLDIEDRKIHIMILAVVAAIQEAMPDADYIQMTTVRSAFLQKLGELEKNPPAPTPVVWT